MIIPGMVPTPLDNYRVMGSPGSFCGAKFFGELPLELGNWRRPRFRIYGIFGSFSFPLFFFFFLSERGENAAYCCKLYDLL